VVVSEVIPIDKVHQELAGSVTVRLPPGAAGEEVLYGLRDVLSAHPGSCPVYIQVRTEGGHWVSLRAGSENHVAPSDRLVADIDNLFGGEHHVTFTPHGDGRKPVS
jgi:hypothetical protein